MPKPLDPSKVPAKLTPTDFNNNRKSVVVNGHTWSYFDFTPPTPSRGTVVLVHGWPDQAIAWRYQIPLLTSLHLRCIALSCAGYGDTGDASDLRTYGFRAHADAVAGIASSLGIDRIILGGHDWGGAVVYRIAQWYPKLVTHVFSVCTPFWPPMERYVSTEMLVQGGLSNFGYQMQLGSEEGIVEKVVDGEKPMEKFLKGMYGGRTSSGRVFFTPEKGLDLKVFEEDEVSMTPLMSREELEFYVAEFVKNGIHGPCNWYRTRRVNYEDEVELPKDVKYKIQQPTLYILANKDNVLTAELSKGMEKYFARLTRGEVRAGHWALWEAAQELNDNIKQWVESAVFGGQSKI